MQLNIRKNKPISLFWILQISGWVLYWASHLLTSTMRQGWSQYQFLRYSSSSISGFLVTLLLRFIYKKLKYRSRSLVKIALTGLFFSLLAANILVWISNLMRIPLWGAEATLFGNLTLLAYLKKVFWWIIPFVGWSALYFGIKFRQEWQLQNDKAEQAQALARSAQLQSLRYRLNPHFMFNALNAVRALIRENQEQAKVMITELSEVLRYSLVSRNAPLVPWHEEVASVRHYLNIEKIRYEDKLDFSLAVGEGTEDCSVPSFILQPLVEEAVRCGMRDMSLPLRIHIASVLSSTGLLLSVTYSGAEERNQGHNNNLAIRSCLNQVNRKLEEAYPGKFVVNLTIKQGVVNISLELGPVKAVNI